MGYRDQSGVWHDTLGDPGFVNQNTGNDNQFASNTGFVGSFTAQQPGPGGQGPGAGPQAGDLPWGNVQRQSAFWYGGDRGVAPAEESRYAGLAAAADARTGPQMNLANYNRDMSRQATDEQNANYALSRYQGLIDGSTVSPAQQQLAQGQAAGLAAAQSGVASARGGGNALVAAQAAGADAGARLTGAYGAAQGQLRAREAMGALQGYGDVSSQRRAQDLSAEQQAANMGYQQAQLESGQRGLNDQRAIANEQARQKVFSDQYAARQAGEAANAGVYQQNAQRRQKAAEDDTSQRNALLTGTLGAITGAASTVSDVRAKKDIVPAGPEVDAAMEQMSPYGYRYKQPEKHGAGPQVGPMAQDLAATPAGRTAVVEMPDGKLALDAAGSTKLSLAGIARLHDRVSQLEAQRDPLQAHAVDLSYMAPEEMALYKDARARMAVGQGTPEDAAFLVDAKKRGAPVAMGQLNRPQPAADRPPDYGYLGADYLRAHPELKGQLDRRGLTTEQRVAVGQDKAPDYSHLKPEYLRAHPELRGQLLESSLSPEQRAAFAPAPQAAPPAPEPTLGGRLADIARRAKDYGGTIVTGGLPSLFADRPIASRGQ
jgi:hypothetical protein